MKKQLIELAKHTLELWRAIKTIKTPGLFGEEVNFFDEEPECVKLSRRIIEKYGED